MNQHISGNTKGLKPSQFRALERIYRRRVPPSEVISHELATYMAEISLELNRQVGAMITRRGAIANVMVGDATSLTVPDVGRLRGGPGRFRGLRLVHTHLMGEKLTRDDLTDLALLRLDLVAAVQTEQDGRPGLIYSGHLLPDNPAGELWRELDPEPVYAQTIDFAELMTALESEFARKTRTVATASTSARALLVQLISRDGASDAESRMAELRELCRTAEVEICDELLQRRPRPDPKYLVGRGKLQQLLLRAMQLGADTVIFDQNLSPGQARAISDFTELKVLDRTMLILDIFAQHARSRDGRLQVELAQLKYALPRLVEKNSMMSRLTGGIGGRGPGETKLEVSRRRARERIRVLEKRRDEVARSRRLRRKRRSQREVPIVAIVGYTNAGKSTLLNALTHGDARAANLLFATLDPVSRRLRFPEEKEVVLTDTVGFIRDLPPDLMQAFRATLEELSDADLLLHVVDGSDDDYEGRMSIVGATLADLDLAEKPTIVVLNKSDRISADDADRRARSSGGVAVSALDTDTLQPLLDAIHHQLWREGRSISDRSDSLQ